MLFDGSDKDKGGIGRLTADERNLMKKEDLLKTKIEKALEQVRPGIESHGGGLKLVSVKNGTVRIRIRGACVGCPMAQATFDEGVSRFLKEKVGEVKKVEFVE